MTMEMILGGVVLGGVGPGLDNFSVVSLLALQVLLSDACQLMPT